MNNEKTMPSGATLRLVAAPFADAKDLHQALLSEIAALGLSGATDINEALLLKIFCASLSSKTVERALDKCLARSLYNGQKITSDVFEKEEARQDYVMVCWEVAHLNVHPFLKHLGSVLSSVVNQIGAGQK